LIVVVAVIAAAVMGMVTCPAGWRRVSKAFQQVQEPS